MFCFSKTELVLRYELAQVNSSVRFKLIQILPPTIQLNLTKGSYLPADGILPMLVYFQ